MPVKDLVTTRHADMAQVFSQKLQAWAHKEDIFSPSMTATRQRLGIKSKFDIEDDVQRQSAAFMWLLKTNLLFRLLFLGRYDLIKLYFYPDKKFKRNHKRFLAIRDNLITETSPGSAKIQYEPKKLDHKTIEEIVEFLEHMQETPRHGNYLRLAVLKAQYHQVVMAYYAERRDIYVQLFDEVSNMLDAAILNPDIPEDVKIKFRQLNQVIQDQANNAIVCHTMAEANAVQQRLVACVDNVIKGDLAIFLEENKNDPNLIKLKSTLDKSIQNAEMNLKSSDDKFLPLIDSFQKDIKQLTEQNHYDVAALLIKILNISEQFPFDHLSSEAQEEFKTVLERLNQNLLEFRESKTKQCAENFRLTFNELSQCVQDVAEFNNLVIQMQDVLNRELTLAYPEEQEEFQLPIDTRLIQEIVRARPDLILQPVAKPQSRMFSQHPMKSHLNQIKQEELKVAEVEYEIPETLHDELTKELSKLLMKIKRDPLNEEAYSHLTPILEKIKTTNTVSNTEINTVRSELKELARNDVNESLLENISSHCDEIENPSINQQLKL